MMNFSEESQTVELQAPIMDLVSNQRVSGQVTLAPYEVRVLIK